MKLQAISIIIPVLNEQDTVQALVERIAQTAFLYTFAYEIIFVDDHSTDKTREIITNLATKYPVYLHTKQGKRGKNQSLLEGFSQAQYDVLCMIDGDLQYPPENLPKMMEKIENGADIVVANRKKKRFSDLFLYRFLHNLDCDVQSGLKVFRKEVFMKVSQDRSSGSFDLNFLVNARRAGFVIAAHPITFYPRYIGKSKESIIKKSVATGWTALKLLPYKRLQYTNVIFPSFAFISVFLFALWWFSASHIPHNFSGNFKIFDILLFILVSYIIWHPIIMEVLTWSISSHIKETNVQEPLPGLKVAFITTIVPANESLDLLHKCLPAMVNADYSHDTWLLDESNSPEVKEICKLYGVKHFSRFGNDTYNAAEGKFARKTKGGNHNAWYDMFGHTYDVVAQIDTDFVAKSTFLTKTLGYFRDPKVAFVGTPQIYGNIKDSFIAKGAAEQQYNFYGSILRGLSGMNTALLIGANHVIRVAALKDVDHYSAHITEDLLTGMKLHTKGWKSVYLSTPLAVGEGPTTWEAYFNQQMRWAYGCMDILFRYSATLFKKMGMRRTLYYFFLQQHYFSGIAMALSIVLLSLYFFTGINATNMSLITFFTFYSGILLLCWLMSVWLQKFHVDPEQESGLLLAGKIISIAAWPIYFLAFISVLRKKRLTYKVTPKGNKSSQKSAFASLFIPHVFFGTVSLLGLLSAFFTHRENVTMMFWAFSSAFLMFTVPFSERTAKAFSRTRSNFLHRVQNIYTNHTEITFNLSKPGFLSLFSKNERKKESFIGSKIGMDQNSEPSQKLGMILDCLFLGFVVIASLAYYVQKLGFYSDDWSFLGNFALSKDQSILGLFHTATTPNTQMRPIQNFYDALLYSLFGVHPLGYQLVNAGVMVFVAVLFYLVLRQLKLPRIIAVAAPLVYTLLPNYSADRFWYAAFQANLSMLFYFLSLYAGLRAFAITTVQRGVWKVISIFSLLISALSYEVVLPLFLINIIFLWNPAERLRLLRLGKKPQMQNPTIFIVLTGITLVYALIFKDITTIRLNGSIFPPYPEYLGYLLSASLKVNYWTWVINSPHILWEFLSHYTSPTMLITGVTLGIAIFVYLVSIIFDKRSTFPHVSWMFNLTIFSFIIFILGYAIFITNGNLGFSPTGIENRVAIAAALGVAFSLIGGVGLISRLLLPEKLAKLFFCLLIAAISTGGFLVINTLSTFWITAYEQSQTVLSSFQEQFPVFPKESTILIDGVCPYVGPASVFESEWDVKGAMQTIYHDATLQADIVTPRLQVKKDALYTTIYSFTAKYPYKNLYVYNFKDKKLYLLPNEKSAHYYFEEHNADFSSGCPAGSAGNGVNVF